MADFRGKLTVFFGAQGQGLLVGGGAPPTGWTETFYRTTATYEGLRDLGIKYVKKRKELLGVGAQVIGLRVSSDEVVRDSLIEQFFGKDGIGGVYTHSPDDDYDPTQVDLLVRMQAGELVRRSLFLSGLPDSQTDQLLSQGIKGAFVNSPQFKQWTQFIIDNQFAIRKVVTIPPAPPVITLQQITEIKPRMIRNRKRGRPFDLFRGRRL